MHSGADAQVEVGVADMGGFPCLKTSLVGNSKDYSNFGWEQRVTVPQKGRFLLGSTP